MKNVFVFLIFIGSMAQASDLSYLPAQTEAQKTFKAELQSGNYSRALRDWNDAYSGSAFAATEDGKATRLFVLAQNGFPMSAARQLMRETTASDLDAQVLALWNPLMKSYVSDMSPGSGIDASWMRHFASGTVTITKKTQIAGALAKAMALPSENVDKPAALFNVATAAPQFNDTDSALKALTALKQLKQNQIGADQIDLATARVLYQAGKVDAALERYNAIPKSSDYWIEALEERAWAHLRKNDHDGAVNDITTLLAAPMAPLGGPEPYFLSTLTSLQVCDYPKILRTTKQFKERHKDRLAQIETLAKLGGNKAVDAVLNSIDENGYNFRAVGANITLLPRDFMRDRAFSSAMKRRLELMTENRNANDSDAPEAKAWIAENESIAAKSRATAVQRLKSLAAVELNDYRITINKLHIVEAEVIQRLYVDERLRGKRKDVALVKDDRNTMHFPYSDDEIWVDELDHYKSSVKDCPVLPSTKGASL